MSNYHRINKVLRAIHINVSGNMRAEVSRQQLDFSLLEHIAIGYIFKFGSVSQQMLVELMEKDKAQISRVVARLLRQDLIKKQQSPTDKRAVLLELSSKGEKLLARLNQVELEVTIDMLAGFSEEEVTSLSFLLDRINNNLKSQ